MRHSECVYIANIITSENNNNKKKNMKKRSVLRNEREKSEIGEQGGDEVAKRSVQKVRKTSLTQTNTDEINTGPMAKNADAK